MPDAAQIEVYNPQGKLGLISSAQLEAAKSQGYKPKADYVEVVHPKTGQTGIVPKDQWGDDKKPGIAQTQGFVMSPREQQRAKQKAGAAIQSEAERNPLAVASQGTGAMGITATSPKDVEAVRQANKNLALTSGAVVGGMATAPLAASAEAVGGGSQLLRWLLPAIARSTGVGVGTGVSDVATGGKPKEALGTASKAAALELGGEAILGAAGAGAKALKSTKVDPLTKINNLLGVGQREIRVGRMPESLDELASNPARGVVKSGIDEQSLAKMNPLERHKVITQARESVGKQLDQVLKAASDAGKTVDITKPVANAFKNIPDANLAAQAEAKFQQILAENGINKPLSQLTPTEARTIQRGLEGFNREVATDLRRGISAATRKVVPESAALDMHYGDLAGASKATERGVKKFAREVPENKLRKWIIKAAVTGAGIGGAYETGKHIAAMVPGGARR